MRILQLGKFYPFSGGIERVMFDLADGLSSQGDICDILCASVGVGNKNVNIEVNERFHIYATRSVCKFMGTVIAPSIVLKLKLIMVNYDLIHIHHPDPMVALALFLSGFKGTIVLHWHSDIIKQKKILCLYSILQNWLLRRSAIIVTTSPVYLEGSLHLAKFKNKCVSIPIGIEQKKNIENDIDVRNIRTLYSGKKIIYSLGRLIYYKGFEYLIDSALYLDDNYVILIGGGGPLYNDLENQIKRNKVEHKVKLLGRIPDAMMDKYYQACDLFCMSSIEKSEAFGIAQIEAMGFGKPIVATKIPNSGVSWVNEDGVSGLNVDCRDSKGLAQAFEKILSDDCLYHEFSEGSIKRFKSVFLKEKMVNRIGYLYKNVLNSRESVMK